MFVLNPKPVFTPLSILQPTFFTSSFTYKPKPTLKPLHLFSVSSLSDPNPKSQPKPKPKPKPKNENPQLLEADNTNEVIPRTIPRKPRRGRRSEAAAVEDFVRDKLEETFEAIRGQTAEVLEDKEKVLKDNKTNKKKKKQKGEVVEEEDPNWPLDADVGWGTRASDYFDKHSIKNVVGDDGVEIDWEGEIDDNYVKEINCLEWESFAFHPSPLIVLVFERYNRANDNWKLLKELEKAIKVFWNAKDRLPPRTVKIDINIERDLAYALRVRECPQLLFLRGNRILYREKGIRTADELYNPGCNDRQTWRHTRVFDPRHFTVLRTKNCPELVYILATILSVEDAVQASNIFNIEKFENIRGGDKKMLKTIALRAYHPLMTDPAYAIGFGGNIWNVDLAIISGLNS